MSERIRYTAAFRFANPREAKRDGATLYPPYANVSYSYKGTTAHPLRYVDSGRQRYGTLHGKWFVLPVRKITDGGYTAGYVIPGVAETSPLLCRKERSPIPLGAAREPGLAFPGLPKRPSYVGLVGVRTVAGVDAWLLRVRFTPVGMSRPVTAGIFISLRTHLPLLFRAAKTYRQTFGRVKGVDKGRTFIITISERIRFASYGHALKVRLPHGCGSG